VIRVKIKLSDKKKGVIGIAGHVGCGHSHSLNNQIQDDSAGLSVVLSLFKEATDISLKIKEFIYEDKKVTVILENGGQGYGIARRGITKQEQNMISRMIGSEVINTHTMVLEQFGRVYGQGVLETPVAVQTALANAALNSFEVNFPEQFYSVKESVNGNCGNIVGTVLNMDGIDVSVLGTVNATVGGIGPNEDLEGNSPYYSKKDIVERLGMDKIPTLIIEAMVSSAFSEGLTENTYFVRGDEEDDNMVVLNAIIKACGDLNYPVKHHIGGMKRTKGALRSATEKVGEKIILLGEKLKKAETSEEKVNIISDIALVVSQDCGGISFMSNDIHEQLGGAGMIKKTSAVINLVVTPDYAIENPIPFLTEKECKEYVSITKETIKNIFANLTAATEIINS
jgi:hypothetical protein